MRSIKKTSSLPEEDHTKNFRLSFKVKTPSGMLFLLAGTFLFLSSAVLSAAPAVRSQSISDFRWDHWLGFFVWLVAFSLIRYFTKNLKSKTDTILLAVTGLLVGWGLLAIWRVEPYFGLRQTIWILVSAVVFILGLRVHADLNFLRKYKYLLLVSGLAFTGLTLIFGSNPLGVGPSLWLNFGEFYMQPSEPLKLLLVIYLAAYFADRQPFITRLVPLIAPTVLMAGVTLGILAAQRDLGTASIFIVIYAGMIYIATGKRRMLLISLAILLAAGAAGYVLFDLVQLRIEAWLNPWQDPSGRTYQIIQSLLAISAGGVGGRGLGLGSPGLVPIAHSDFIFSTISEEFGLIGSLGLILAITLITFRAIKIGLSAANFYHRYLALGIAIYLASQSILIIGGNIRLLPLTGVTLPFVSYGGSSLVTSMLAVLLLTKILQHSDHEKNPNLNRTAPLFHIAGVLLVGFSALALVTSWWAVWRGPDLLTRTDNARRTLSDYTVPRGDILDRYGKLLNTTLGESGGFFRVYQYPSLGPVLGYTDPFYGQAGAEASLDPILRGVENNNPWTVWVNHLLYGQSPVGLDTRISLDLELQNYAADLFGTIPGALVLLDAESGEILVMHSSPYYDPNTLEDDWQVLLENRESPLLNRAAQGRYSPGTALNPFLLAAVQPEGDLPETITSLEMQLSGSLLTCTRSVALTASWAETLSAGCPEPAAYLGLQLGDDGLYALFDSLGFYTPPQIRLPVSHPSQRLAITSPEIAAAGQAGLEISPLQLALAGAALSNGGIIPAPQFLLAAQNPDGGWTNYDPVQQPIEIFTKAAAEQAAMQLAGSSQPYWETTAFGYTQSGDKITWFLAGTLPGADDPLVVAVLLEYHGAGAAQQIGRRILQAAGAAD